MKARRVELLNQMPALQASDKPEDIETLSNVLVDAEKLDKAIATKEAAEAFANRMAAPKNAVQREVPVAPAQSPARKASKFSNLGDFAVAVRNASQGRFDSRLLNVQSDQRESVDGEGGYLVPTDERGDIIKHVFAEDGIIARCTQIPTQSKLVEWPYATGGVTAAFTGEGVQIAGSFETFDMLQIPVYSAKALVKVTDEMAADAPALSAYLVKELSRAFRNVITNNILNGLANSTTTPKGVLTGAACLVVAKEAAQAADSLLVANIDNLYAALAPDQRANAVWVISPSVEKKLMALRDPETKAKVYIQPNALAPNVTQAVPSQLYGRPVIVSQYAPALGEAGDISFVDFSGYYLAIRQAMESQTSVHFFFDTGVQALRATVRVGGAPAWKDHLTLADGSEVSYAAALAERA